jgi:radical SAM superfamily enzyme YgiQ (UPF0313 family)
VEKLGNFGGPFPTQTGNQTPWPAVLPYEQSVAFPSARLWVVIAKRSGRKVCLVGLYPKRDPAMPEKISNHGLRMVEATLRASRVEDLQIEVLDLVDARPDDLLDEILEIDPDIVGFSAYLWSFPTFDRVARELRQQDASRVIVFGGPSARPAMLNLTPFHPLREAVDVLVTGEGEDAFLEIVSSPDRSFEAWKAIPGLALWRGQNWYHTPARPLGDLNLLSSPYTMGIVPRGGLAVLQTYRGCPFSCAYCEWGTMESPKRVRTQEHLIQELSAMESSNPLGALMVDAGLNLNERAFQELAAAAQATGYFKNKRLICEVYPAKIQKHHMDFMSQVGEPLIGVGLQSFDKKTLSTMERSLEEDKFDSHIEQMNQFAHVAIEIIMGLPGDTPETFRQTFWRARRYPCTLRVYHCVVLPSALMVRSPPEHRLDYDPITLKMNSCLGWTAESIDQECRFLTSIAEQTGGAIGEFLWVFPPP